MSKHLLKIKLNLKTMENNEIGNYAKDFEEIINGKLFYNESSMDTINWYTASAYNNDLDTCRILLIALCIKASYRYNGEKLHKNLDVFREALLIELKENSRNMNMIQSCIKFFKDGGEFLPQ